MERAPNERRIARSIRKTCTLQSSCASIIQQLLLPVRDGNSDFQPGLSMSAVDDLLSILDLEHLEVNLFRGRSPQSRWQRVFGGQVIGQALVAACRTVEDVAVRPPHSLHAYFLLGGDPKVPIIYEVDRIR